MEAQGHIRGKKKHVMFCSGFWNYCSSTHDAHKLKYPTGYSGEVPTWDIIIFSLLFLNTSLFSHFKALVKDMMAADIELMKKNPNA